MTLHLPSPSTTRNPSALLSSGLVARHDVPAPRYTSYPTADRWAEGVGPADHARALEEAGRRDPAQPLSLYVHIPFCRSLCLYCGCNVVVTRRWETVDAYLDGLAREVELVAERLGERRRVGQLHWGGGTPTFLDEPRLERLWQSLTGHLRVDPAAEVAVEIDPRVTSTSQLALLRGLGFNRLSLGVQDLSPEVQSAIGRRQSLEETAAVMGTARRLGFQGVNVDLVYGLPEQTAERWARTLDAVVALRPDRVAVYSFAYLPDLRPAQRRLPVLGMARGQDKLGLLLEAHARFERAGYRPVGMDHFALPTDELARAQARGALRRNFQGYTAGEASDVIGLGATAISDLGGGHYAQNTRRIASYLEALACGRLATQRGHRLDDEDRRRRRVIGALMCDLAVTLDAADQRHFASELAALAPLADDGLVTIDPGMVTVTELGRLFLRNVAMAFDGRRSRERPAGARAV